MVSKNDTPTDQELVSLTLINPEAFGAIMKRYESKLRRYIQRISRFSDDEIEIILQDAFIKMYRYINDYDHSLAFSSWAYRITHNETIDRIRKNKRSEYSTSLDDDEENLIEKLASDDTGIAEAIDTEIQKKSVLKILQEIEPKYKSILVLRFLEEKSYEEIADILKKPPGTIATLVRRAKEKFRKKASEADKRIKETL